MEMKGHCFYDINETMLNWSAMNYYWNKAVLEQMKPYQENKVEVELFYSMFIVRNWGKGFLFFSWRKPWLGLFPSFLNCPIQICFGRQKYRLLTFCFRFPLVLLNILSPLSLCCRLTTVFSQSIVALCKLKTTLSVMSG